MNEKVQYYKTFILRLGLFKAVTVKSYRLLKSTHVAFLILLLPILHIFLPSSTFAACIYGNCTNGQGTYTWSNGQKYVGEFRDGKANGDGTYTWPNGQKYVGEFKNGRSDGDGTYTWPNGQKYVGEFRDDKSDGYGIYTWPDGQKYFGEFKDDKFSGQGTLALPDGTKHEGEFKDDTPNVQGNGTYPDRGRSAGKFRDDNPAVKGTSTTHTMWYAVFCVTFFFILVALIFLWYRKTVNNNLNKVDQDKNINEDKAVVKEGGMIEEPGQQAIESDAGMERFYQVLQLSPGASKEELRDAYKTLLIVWDPHKRADYPTLQKKTREKINEIDEAYEKLILYMAAESPPASQVENKT